ncbi:KH homology domain-containing protein 4-like isoform X2 [Dysidea avara]|uniref:KH homology domain-containing protein 4-like isoform X2 n=1 Tax=Dysidea avara TaxID=196820 RepID=UPI003321D833
MNSSTTRGRKRSKWDQTPSEVVKPSEAAAEAAARLNAKLAAEGKLVLSNPPQLPPTSATSSSVLASTAAAAAATGTSKEQTCGFFSAEVEINNCIARSELIKTTTLTEINRATGAFVSVRGKYLTSEEQSDSNEKERSQYLHVQSTTQERVNNAVQRIKAIMIGEVTSKMPTMSQQHYVQDKVFIGMDHAPEAFCLLDRLSGPGGSYLAHIAQQTGAKVYLRGKGSGYLEPTSGREAFEALYLYISHPTQNGMVEAKKLCESLVSTVKKDLQQFTTPQGYGAQTSPYPPNMLQPPFYNQYHMMPHGHGPGVLPQQPYAQSIPPSHPPLQGSGTDVVPPPPFQYFSAMPPPPPPYVGAPQHMGPPPPLPMYGALPIPPPPPHTATIPVQSTVLPMEGYPERQPDNSSNTGTQDTSYSNSQSLATSTTNATDTKTPDKPAKRRFTEKPTIQPEILKIRPLTASQLRRE